MNLLKNLIGFLGRACLSVIFILAAVQKIILWQPSEQMIIGALCNWMSYFQGGHWARSIFENALYWTPFLLILAILFEGLGGLLVFLGIKVRLGTFLLILVLIISTFLFDPFWILQGDQKDLQMVMFLKNLSIFGGLLLLLAYGGKGSQKDKKESSHFKNLPQ